MHAAVQSDGEAHEVATLAHVALRVTSVNAHLTCFVSSVVISTAAAAMAEYPAVSIHPLASPALSFPAASMARSRLALHVSPCSTPRTVPVASAAKGQLPAYDARASDTSKKAGANKSADHPTAKQRDVPPH